MTSYEFNFGARSAFDEIDFSTPPETALRTSAESPVEPDAVYPPQQPIDYEALYMGTRRSVQSQYQLSEPPEDKQPTSTFEPIKPKSKRTVLEVLVQEDEDSDEVAVHVSGHARAAMGVLDHISSQYKETQRQNAAIKAKRRVSAAALPPAATAPATLPVFAPASPLEPVVRGTDGDMRSVYAQPAMSDWIRQTGPSESVETTTALVASKPERSHRLRSRIAKKLAWVAIAAVPMTVGGIVGTHEGRPIVSNISNEWLCTIHDKVPFGGGRALVPSDAPCQLTEGKS